MVNKEKFSRRLQDIFDYYDLTASAFAEKIDVGKATISHLLSGRNNPSLDFVLRVVNTFPEVELYWLLNGKGTFPKSSPDPTQKNTKQTHAVASESIPKTEPKANEVTSAPPKEQDFTQSLSSGEVERIVIFFKNGTFKSYKTE